jgi:hypothetical protein
MIYAFDRTDGVMYVVRRKGTLVQTQGTQQFFINEERSTSKGAYNPLSVLVMNVTYSHQQMGDQKNPATSRQTVEIQT